MSEPDMSDTPNVAAPTEGPTQTAETLHLADITDTKAEPNPTPGIAHDFHCTHNPCRCAGITDTPNATTELVEAAIIKAYKDELCSQGWWDFKVGEEVLLGFAARAVLSVPRVAAGLKLLEAIESFELMDPQMSAGRTAQARAVHAGVVGGRNAVLERLRVIAGINDTEVRS